MFAVVRNRRVHNWRKEFRVFIEDSRRRVGGDPLEVVRGECRGEGEGVAPVPPEEFRQGCHFQRVPVASDAGEYHHEGRCVPRGIACVWDDAPVGGLHLSLPRLVEEFGLAGSQHQDSERVVRIRVFQLGDGLELEFGIQSHKGAELEELVVVVLGAEEGVQARFAPGDRVALKDCVDNRGLVRG